MCKEFYESYHAFFIKSLKTEQLKQGFRLKVIQEFLNNDIFKKKILIVGCGSGRDTSVIRNKTYAFDLSFNAVKIARQDFPGHFYLVADANKIPFKDNCFDSVICSEVLEHVEYPDALISEFNRILRPKGELILTVPNWLSFYGLVRKIAEIIFQKPFTASGQPIDNWFTLKKLHILLKDYFKIQIIKGVWYYPPIGRGNKVLADPLFFYLFKSFSFLDRFLGKISPSFGSHILAIKCLKTLS
ncbi:MAG: class I SAM-dependent methyltransferase [Candidatus Omnitrophica bacterium]|nr:class I SAM-dependent methyltransferase [Candidatus Omnitrophota bacterium]